MDKFLRRSEVEEITSLKDPQMWREESAGRFPKRLKLTERTVGWRESEVNEWMNSREIHFDTKPRTLQELTAYIEAAQIKPKKKTR